MSFGAFNIQGNTAKSSSPFTSIITGLLLVAVLIESIQILTNSSVIHPAGLLTWTKLSVWVNLCSTGSISILLSTIQICGWIFNFIRFFVVASPILIISLSSDNCWCNFSSIISIDLYNCPNGFFNYDIKYFGNVSTISLLSVIF